MLSENLSIIIPTKNRKEDLLECINSIVRQNPLPFEIIVVDQSSNQDDAEQIIKSTVNNRARLVYWYDNKIEGLTNARNIGIKYCSGELVLFLDDDAVLLDKCIHNLLYIFENDAKKEIGGIGLAIVNEHGSFRAVASEYIFCHGPFRSFFRYSYFQRHFSHIKQKLFLSRMIGGCACYRRAIFDQFKFDENYKGYSSGEDQIFSFVVSKKFKTYLTPLVMIEHDRLRKHRLNKGLRQRQITFLNFYLFCAYVNKKPYNIFCYFLLVVQDLFKMLFNFYDPSVLRGVFYSYCEIFKVIFRFQTLKEGVQRNLG